MLKDVFWNEINTSIFGSCDFISAIGVWKDLVGFYETVGHGFPGGCFDHFFVSVKFVLFIFIYFFVRNLFFYCFFIIF